MRRSAYALILATGLTSGLGLVFWALAARWLPTATVGLGAALVSVMALLANLSTLGLRNGLIRFLPTAGSASRRLIVTCYALCAVAAMVAAGIFLLGQPLWAERLAFLRDSPLSALAFVIGTAFWVLFVLQDHVLVGLRQTIWVPLENGLCAVAKIALLPLLAFAGGWAVFGAAALPAAAAVLVVTTLDHAVPGPHDGRAGADGDPGVPAGPVRGRRPLRRAALDGHRRPADPAGAERGRTRGQRLLLHGQHDRLHPVPGDQQRRQRAGRRGRPRPGAGGHPGPSGALELGPAGDPARRRRGAGGPVGAGHPRPRLRRQRDAGAAAAARLRHPADHRRHRHRHRPHPA